MTVAAEPAMFGDAMDHPALAVCIAYLDIALITLDKASEEAGETGLREVELGISDAHERVMRLQLALCRSGVSG